MDKKWLKDVGKVGPDKKARLASEEEREKLHLLPRKVGPKDKGVPEPLEWQERIRGMFRDTWSPYGVPEILVTDGAERGRKEAEEVNTAILQKAGIGREETPEKG